MKVAIYVRVSTGKQELDNQLRELRRFAQNSNWEVVGEYKDVISGKEEKRRGFDQLFQDAHKKRFDLVLFWDLSRFSRAGTYHTLLKLRELENLEIKWKSYQEKYIDSAGQFKDVVISVMASLAKIEREKISDRTKAGLNRIKDVIKRKGKYKTREGKIIKRLGKPGKNFDEEKVWNEYMRQGSINKTAKVLPYSYGSVWKIIKKRMAGNGIEKLCK